MKLDFIKQIMSEFDQSNVTKMKVEIDDLKIELEKESEKVIIWCCWQSKIPAAIISALTIRFARAGSWCAIIFTNKETAVNSTGWNFILRRRAVCRKSC